MRSGRPLARGWALSLLFLWAAPGFANPLKVLIDAGHGGKDLGAVQNELKESELTYQVSERLLSRLKSDPRFSAKISREPNQFLQLSERTQAATDFGADVLISIHLNWSNDVKAHGLEVYFQNQLPPDEESMYLASRENLADGGNSGAQNNSTSAPDRSMSPEVHLILTDLQRNQRIYKSSLLARAIKQKWEGTKKSSAVTIRQAPFYVLSNLNIPSVLVELGFLSNPQEQKSLASQEYQATMAQSLFEGLIQYQENSDKSRDRRLK